MFGDLSTTEIIILIISILISIPLHEAMHGFMAHWLGDNTAEDLGRLTLNPLKHIDLVTTIILPIILIFVTGRPFFIAKPVPFNPSKVRFGEYGVALIGLAGPFTNFIIAAGAALFLRLFGGSFDSFTINAIILFIEVNVSLFVFNLIPFPPLDGSRLLYAFAPEPVQEIMQRIESAGFFMILFFMLLVFPLFGSVISNIVLSVMHFLLG